MSITPWLPLSRSRVNRDAENRKKPGFLDKSMSDPSTRIVAVWDGKVLLSDLPSPRLKLLSPADVPSGSPKVYLGFNYEEARDVREGTKIVAVWFSSEQASSQSSPTIRWESPRHTAHLFDDLDSGLAVQAVAMINWHLRHSYSPLTGKKTLSSQAGWIREDPSSETALFPRTDAAVITLVTDQADKILLGSNAMWEANRYSLLAGFVEPGESLEAAAVREVFEEAGVIVADPEYVGSQPWPFPASLMVGFKAKLSQDSINNIRPDGQEIVDLRWFSRADLLKNLGEIHLPARPSIAHAMIQNWLGQPIPGSE